MDRTGQIPVIYFAELVAVGLNSPVDAAIQSSFARIAEGSPQVNTSSFELRSVAVSSVISSGR